MKLENGKFVMSHDEFTDFSEKAANVVITPEQFVYLFEYITENISDTHPGDMNRCSWGYEEGVLLTGNQALKLLAGVIMNMKELGFIRIKD